MKNNQEKRSKNNEVPADNSGVIKAKSHSLILAGTIVYTVLVLYFMFLGFNRIVQNSDYNQYTFMLVPKEVPLRFPKLTMSWLFDFGNIAAFIPFGIVIPLLHRIRFRKFITLFISVILMLEVLQSLTFLGTFDILDVISNTLGAIIGFVGYKVGFTSKITFKRLVASAISILILIVGIIIVSETIDYAVHVNERIGDIQALKEINTSEPLNKAFSNFTVQGEIVQPKFNFFSSEDGISREYVFNVGKKDLWFYANCGILDNEEYKGSVSILLNEQPWIEFSDEDEYKDMLKVKTFFDGEIKNVKIIVTGNARVWDVSIAEIKHWWE